MDEATATKWALQEARRLRSLAQQGRASHGSTALALEFLRLHAGIRSAFFLQASGLVMTPVYKVQPWRTFSMAGLSPAQPISLPRSHLRSEPELRQRMI